MYLATSHSGAVDSFGLVGILFTVLVIPMAVYIVRDKDKQLAEKRNELATLRASLDTITVGLNDAATAMKTAMSMLSDSGSR